MLVRTSRLSNSRNRNENCKERIHIYKANAKAQLTAKPKAAPIEETLRLLEALLKSSDPSDEVPLPPLPLPLPFPPAEEVEFELVE
jgi:hypothetical protein